MNWLFSLVALSPSKKQGRGWSKYCRHYLHANVWTVTTFAEVCFLRLFEGFPVFQDVISGAASGNPLRSRYTAVFLYCFKSDIAVIFFKSLWILVSVSSSVHKHCAVSCDLWAWKIASVAVSRHMPFSNHPKKQMMWFIKTFFVIYGNFPESGMFPVLCILYFQFQFALLFKSWTFKAIKIAVSKRSLFACWLTWYFAAVALRCHVTASVLMGNMCVDIALIVTHKA